MKQMHKVQQELKAKEADFELLDSKVEVMGYQTHELNYVINDLVCKLTCTRESSGDARLSRTTLLAG